MELKEAILTRQSCRAYESAPVEGEKLGAVLRAGCAAPVGRKKYEDVQITVVQKPELLRAITENARLVLQDPQADPLYGAPVLIVTSVREQEGQIAPVSVANAACVVENMHLAATGEGLGSCYLWGVVQTMLERFELLYQLELQDGFWPVSALALGYAKEPAQLRTVPLSRIRTNFIE